MGLRRARREGRKGGRGRSVHVECGGCEGNRCEWQGCDRCSSSSSSC